jgi:hypothetical protein
MSVDGGSSSSTVPSSALLQQLLSEQQHERQMQQHAESLPLSFCTGLGSSTSNARLSMPLSSAALGTTSLQHFSSPTTQQQQQWIAYSPPLQPQHLQVRNRVHRTDSIGSDHSSNSNASGMLPGSSKHSRQAGAASMPGNCSARQLLALEALSTLDEEMQQLQQLQRQLAAAAAAARGTPVASACQAAAQLHQHTMHQALAVKAAVQGSMAATGGATAVLSCTGAAAGAAAGAAPGAGSGL